MVDELVRKLTDARMDLNSATSSAATGFAHAKPTATVRLTDESGTQELQLRATQTDKNKSTYYAKSGAVAGTYKVDADLGQALEKSLDDFRNKKLFDFGFPDPNKIEWHDGTKSLWLTRSGDDWWSNGKKMDAGNVQSFISKVRELSASKFVDAGFNHPTIQVTVTSNDGKRTEKVEMAKSPEGYIAKRENDATLYQLPAEAGEGLQKAAGDIQTPPPVAK
jgi:hypothetical protein